MSAAAPNVELLVVARVLQAVGAASILVGAFWLRSGRHPAAIVEPVLLRTRCFALANAGALYFFMAFGVMLLLSVLFLTQIWHHSVLRAGLEIAPGPAMAAIFA